MTDGTEIRLAQDDFRSMTPAEVTARFLCDAAALIGAGPAAQLLERLDAPGHDPNFARNLAAGFSRSRDPAA
jgi:hypothetical protein